MKTILINGTKVQISAETFKRIEKIATEKNIPFSQAISFCLEKVI